MNHCVDFGLDCSGEIWGNCAGLASRPLSAPPAHQGAHVTSHKF